MDFQDAAGGDRHLRCVVGAASARIAGRLPLAAHLRRCRIRGNARRSSATTALSPHAPPCICTTIETRPALSPDGLVGWADVALTTSLRSWFGAEGHGGAPCICATIESRTALQEVTPCCGEAALAEPVVVAWACARGRCSTSLRSSSRARGGGGREWGAGGRDRQAGRTPSRPVALEIAQMSVACLSQCFFGHRRAAAAVAVDDQFFVRAGGDFRQPRGELVVGDVGRPGDVARGELRGAAYVEYRWCGTVGDLPAERFRRDRCTGSRLCRSGCRSVGGRRRCGATPQHRRRQHHCCGRCRDRDGRPPLSDPGVPWRTVRAYTRSPRCRRTCVWWHTGRQRAAPLRFVRSSTVASRSHTACSLTSGSASTASPSNTRPIQIRSATSRWTICNGTGASHQMLARPMPSCRA